MDGAPSSDQDGLRASDQDRHQVAERLHAAAAEGRLTLAELDERLETLYAARTYGELVPLTRDLPATGTPPAAAMVPRTAAEPGLHGPSVSVGIMSGCDRGGEWVVPAQHTAVALMGGVALNLTKARFAASHVTITCVALMGGIEVIVPEDLNVEVDGFAFMDGFDRGGAGHRPGGPTVRITGFAMMGGIEVKRAKPAKKIEAPE